MELLDDQPEKWRETGTPRVSKKVVEADIEKHENTPPQWPVLENNGQFVLAIKVLGYYRPNVREET